MRIVFISSMAAYPWGGSEELWSQAATRLAGSGHQVVASVTHWPTLSPKVTALKDHGIDLQPRMPAPAPTLALRIWRRLARTKGVTPEQRDRAWLLRQKPDLVVISQGYILDGLAWMKLCLEAGLPFIPIVQCNDQHWWPSDERCREAIPGYRGARQIFCVSQHNLKLLEYQLGELLPQAEVVWNPFNVPAADPPAWPPETGVWKLACVGRIEPLSKGQDLLLEVLARPQWRERPVEVNLYGTGPWEEGMRRLATYLQLEKVHFRGHVTDINQVWADNHLLVLPSRYEGLPLALVEAMWCGRPAVVTDVGGNAEMCVEGETGFIAAAPTAKLLEETMERAWNQRARWPALGRAARVRTEKLVPNDPVGDFIEKLKLKRVFGQD